MSVRAEVVAEDRSLWLLWGGFTAAALAAWGLFSIWMPSSDPAYSVCFSRRVLDRPCPGCGLTRAFSHLSRGDWQAAFLMHPLVYLFALQGLAVWSALPLMACGRLRRPDPVWIHRGLVLNVVLLLATYVVRIGGGWLPP